ncbi:MAG TPA: GNAT family N-acetyltransferase [Dehalococcoidia bacterium]|nr:GNAT family N-acetyltransferase [Dehalococcoidia bacterium]
MTSTSSPLIQPLSLAQVDSLRLPFAGSWAIDQVRERVTKYPQFAFWSPNTRDYILGGFWRGRPEVGLLAEATGNNVVKTALVQRQAEAFAECGSLAMVLSDPEVDRAERFYLGLGWPVLEEMVQYERHSCHVESDERPQLTLRPFMPDDLASVTNIDRRAFRWLWWNDPQDFLQYCRLPDVHAFTTWHGEDLVGYVSYTLREGRGHIDRIAIDPDFQGRGYGADLLIMIMQRMEREGGRNVGLNTQSDNQRAHNLYGRFGFDRQRWGFRIVGKWLTDTPMETGGA